METVRRVVPVDWTDYNGHMNEGRYGQVFSDAADGLCCHRRIRNTWLAGTVSLPWKQPSTSETHAGEDIVVDTRVAG